MNEWIAFSEWKIHSYSFLNMYTGVAVHMRVNVKNKNYFNFVNKKL